MDDDFILVSKNEITTLRKENEELKKKIKEKPEPVVSQKQDIDIDDFVGKLVQVLHEESQKERELIIENLNEIKDLNRSTLDNLLTKTEKLDGQLEEMVDSISGLVDNLANIANKFSKTQNFDDLIKKIRDSPAQVSPEVIDKLDEIDVFMKNLRILLSYVKPNDLVRLK